MKSFYRYSVVGILGILSFFVSVCVADPAAVKHAQQQGSMSKMPLQPTKEDAYTQYLNQMKQLNADRQCANLAPQHVYSYKEYKQEY